MTTSPGYIGKCGPKRLVLMRAMTERGAWDRMTTEQVHRFIHLECDDELFGELYARWFEDPAGLSKSEISEMFFWDDLFRRYGLRRLSVDN